MKRRVSVQGLHFALLGMVLLSCIGANASPLILTSQTAIASFSLGNLTGLTARNGHVFITNSDAPTGIVIHCIGGDHTALPPEDMPVYQPDGRVLRACRNFAGLPGAWGVFTYEAQPSSGDIIIGQDCTSPKPGVWGVEWAIERIPLEMNIIVPGFSGNRFTKHSPGALLTFDYPMFWEAQLVVIEGAGRGFYVWADDTTGRYKRLNISRTPEGWRLGFVTINFAPFEALTDSASVKWHLNVYEGDWRVPARRYREWAETHFLPVPTPGRQPAWIKDVRCFVVSYGIDIPMLESLTTRLDPRQTLLFLGEWRKQGSTRDYPNYSEPVDALPGFLRRAHQLGYHVMLYVNHFACSPDNPVYPQFERYQVRSPWGSHEKEWFLFEWDTPGNTDRIAYINPASAAWRSYFVDQMTRLCTSNEVDVLHLDQTLVIENDHNGLIDGVSMLQGNILLHEQLRAALPSVALGGEGLNEITYRHEAFAVRHIWASKHATERWNRPWQQSAHPISSFLFRPYCVLYAFLGFYPSPNLGQVYATWNDSYEHWGLIPSLLPDTGQVLNPSGFMIQFFDEVRLWHDYRVDIDLDGDWPEVVCFPFRATNGERVLRMADHSLVRGDTEISRTIRGVSTTTLPGTILDWPVYDAAALRGLDQNASYPYVTSRRSLSASHLERVCQGFLPSCFVEKPNFLFMRVEKESEVLADLAELVGQAVCGYRNVSGKCVEAEGPLWATNGSMFTAFGDFFAGSQGILWAHPPWNGELGVAYARYGLALPTNAPVTFRTRIALSAPDVDQAKTDGVTFGVAAWDLSSTNSIEVHQTNRNPAELNLDLSAFGGKQISLELSVHPGPQMNPGWDLARWLQPRIEKAVPAAECDLLLVSTNNWSLALFGTNAIPLQGLANRYQIAATLPGDVFLIERPPSPMAMPYSLGTGVFNTVYVLGTGHSVSTSVWARAELLQLPVGGVTRSGIFVSPPDYGQTIAFFALTLPAQPAEFHSYVGIYGDQSQGVTFSLCVNGIQLAQQKMLPGRWAELRADLGAWTNKTVALSLVTDSDGSFYCDWAMWGEPQIRPLTKIAQARLMADGTVQMVLLGERGRDYHIEASENLRDWFPTASLSFTNFVMQFSDTCSTNSTRKFYRLVQF